MSASYVKEFSEWRKRKGIRLRHHLQDVLPSEQDLRVGDIVAYTNPNGVTSMPYVVLGIDPTPDNGRCVYLDWECYWFPVAPSKVKLLKRNNNK